MLSPQLTKEELVLRNAELVLENAHLSDANLELEQQLLEANIENVEIEQSQDEVLKEQKLASLGEVAAGIAHDFNNILAGILGYAELLKKNLNENPKAVRQLNYIISSSTRGARLTEILLGLTQNRILNLNCIEMQYLIHEIHEALGKIIEPHIKIIRNIENTVLKIDGDYQQLYQAILQIAENGIEAMPQGGRLELSISQVKADIRYCNLYSYLKPGSYIKLSIKDSGNGIDPKSLKKIFDPFFTTKEIGNGLGLSLAHSIITQHEGIIHIESNLNKGTDFQIYFPAAENPAEDPQDHATTDKASSSSA